MKTSYPTRKLEGDKSKEGRILFSILTGHNAHILTIITVGHLLVEHYLDRIITEKIENKKTILKMNFSEKLKILYPAWLPLFIYKNIILLNAVRNYVAHNLGVIEYKPIVYTSNRGERILSIPKRKNKEKTYFCELINYILFDLVNYSSYTLNIPAEPDLNTIFKKK